MANPTEPPDIQGNLTPEQHEAAQHVLVALQSIMRGCWVLNAEGEPEPATDPCAFMEVMRDPRRQVERTIICDGVEVSTVFLCIDHGIGLSERPVLWETMVFDKRPRVERTAGRIGRRPNFDGHSCRYSSRDEALAGHQRIVAMVRDVVTPG